MQQFTTSSPTDLVTSTNFITVTTDSQLPIIQTERTDSQSSTTQSATTVSQTSDSTIQTTVTQIVTDSGAGGNSRQGNEDNRGGNEGNNQSGKITKTQLTIIIMAVTCVAIVVASGLGVMIGAAVIRYRRHQRVTKCNKRREHHHIGLSK